MNVWSRTRFRVIPSTNTNLDRERIENNYQVKDLEVLVDEKFNMTRKAFETFSCEILIDKLIKYVPDKWTLKWTENELNFQAQKVVSSSVKRRRNPVTNTVAQGLKPADLFRKAQNSLGCGCNTRAITVSLSITASKFCELIWGTSKSQAKICEFFFLDPEEQIKFLDFDVLTEFGSYPTCYISEINGESQISLTQGLAIDFVEPHEDPMHLFLKLVQVPLDGFQCVNCTKHLGVVCKLDGGAFNPFAYIIDEDVKQYWSPIETSGGVSYGTSVTNLHRTKLEIYFGQNFQNHRIAEVGRDL
ncbi:hypothetical protein BTVI_62583 [Pitangus sulphuratus]|nr:hypothetical protein BTVI_62583 [Pitangus sulphuratus]